MKKSDLVRVAVVLCVCATLGSGCKSWRLGRKRGGDTVSPEEMDIMLSERFGDGERITDVDFSSVIFRYDSFQITDSEIAKIDRVAEYMGENSRVRLITEGHCDERGSREYNMSLGEHRALAVRARLIGLGIAGSRVQTRSYGEESPVDAGHSESAWRSNRRVEFALYR